MFRFEHPQYLYFLLVIPLLVLIYIISRYTRKNNLKKYGNISLLNQLMPDYSGARPAIKFILVSVALGFILVALARPQFGTKLEEVKREGVELIIALDVSNSMLAQDIQPNRLERAKQAISRLTSRLRDDKIGMIVFAGDAYVQVPITTDYSSVKLFLDAINTEIVPKQGTAIGSAIEMAMKSFTPDSEMKKAIIIITDGENHEDDPVQAARKAAEEGIVVHTIGMGKPKGAPVPADRTSNTGAFRKDRQGNVVVSKLDEQMLEKIASAGDGVYIRANNTRVGLDKLFDEINSMDKTTYEARKYSEYDERFQYFIATALILLLLEFLLQERRNKWLSRFKLFD